MAQKKTTTRKKPAAKTAAQDDEIKAIVEGEVARLVDALGDRINLDLDVNALYAYAQIWALEKKAFADLIRLDDLTTSTPQGAVVKHPLVSIWEALNKSSRLLGRELGLSPLARKENMVREEDLPADEFEAAVSEG